VDHIAPRAGVRALSVLRRAAPFRADAGPLRACAPRRNGPELRPARHHPCHCLRCPGCLWQRVRSAKNSARCQCKAIGPRRFVGPRSPPRGPFPRGRHLALVDLAVGCIVVRLGLGSRVVHFRKRLSCDSGYDTGGLDTRIEVKATDVP
jgi:hypothetical protein